MACAKATIRRSPSLNLRRYGQMQLGMQVVTGIIWFLMSVLAAIKSDYFMSPDIYGSSVTSVYAEVWLYPLLISSIIYTFGIFINGNWRWSPLLRLLGSLVQLVVLSLFGIMSFNYDSIDPFTMSCFPLCAYILWCVALNLGDSKRAIMGTGWNEQRHRS